MEYSKKEIDEMLKKAKLGIYYTQEDLEKSNNKTKDLQKYSYEGKKID